MSAGTTHLPKVFAVIGDDGVAQHKLYEVAQGVSIKRCLVCAFQAQPEVIVQRYVKKQNIPRCALSLQSTVLSSPQLCDWSLKRMPMHLRLSRRSLSRANIQEQHILGCTFPLHKRGYCVDDSSYCRPYVEKPLVRSDLGSCRCMHHHSDHVWNTGIAEQQNAFMNSF